MKDPIEAVHGQIDAENWNAFASCRPGSGINPDIFYPEDRHTVEGKLQAAEAVVLCLGCRATDFCLRDRLNSRDRAGVRGGMTETEYLNAARKEKLNGSNRQVTLEETAAIRAEYTRPLSPRGRADLAKKVSEKRAAAAAAESKKATQGNEQPTSMAA